MSRLQRRRQRLADFFAIGLARHVDKIDDDYAADIAQPQLLHHLVGRFQVGLEDGVILILLADEAPGVHVDRGQRFGLIEHQVAARLEPYLAVERALDLRLDIEPVEYRLLPLMQLARARSRGI